MLLNESASGSQALVAGSAVEGDRRLKADGTRRALKHDGGSRGGIKGASSSARGSVLSECTPPLRRLIHSTSCLCAASFHSFFTHIDPRPFASVLRVCITVRFDLPSGKRSHHASLLSADRRSGRLSAASISIEAALHAPDLSICPRLAGLAFTTPSQSVRSCLITVSHSLLVLIPQSQSRPTR